jgi:mannose-6-phosphate isomerase-like protein (cupin superfamily)
MGYHHIDPADVEQLDDRPADVRGITAAAGLEPRDSKLGIRLYGVAPGQQVPLSYHYHDEQVEAFYVLDGRLHVETPDGEVVVGADEALVIEPGSPQFAYNPEDAGAGVRLLAVGAPSVDDAHTYEPDGDGGG